MDTIPMSPDFRRGLCENALEHLTGALPPPAECAAAIRASTKRHHGQAEVEQRIAAARQWIADAAVWLDEFEAEWRDHQVLQCSSTPGD